MLPSTHTPPKAFNGLVVDLFAGGGGASEGLAQALGRDPDIAINHDSEALAMHKANHPGTRHLLNDITRVLPLEATGGQPVAILHASPDCTHFSKAKGAKPRSQFIRDLAWTVVRWAEDTRPILITLENVEEFLTWGPLNKDGHPIKAHAGDTFRAWVKRLRRLGYKISWRLLRACDYGAPTTRRRLFVVARRDGLAPVWPKPTHGAPNSPGVIAGKLLPWRTAAECIDWQIPSQSIFARKKPLALNTQRRIAEGLRRYVLGSAEPFIVCCNHAGNFRGQSVSDPLGTVTGKLGFGVVSPVISGCVINPNHVAKDYTPFRGHSILASACMVKYYGTAWATSLSDPIHTITSKDRMGLVSAEIGVTQGRYEQVRAWLRLWGVIGQDDEAEIIHEGVVYRLVDICMRMLAPRELYTAQGFGPDYQIAPVINGKPLSKTAQVRMCGNSVPPPFEAAIVRANGPETWVETLQPDMPLVRACGVAV